MGQPCTIFVSGPRGGWCGAAEDIFTLTVRPTPVLPARCRWRTSRSATSSGTSGRSGTAPSQARRGAGVAFSTLSELAIPYRIRPALKMCVAPYLTGAAAEAVARPRTAGMASLRTRSRPGEAEQVTIVLLRHSGGSPSACDVNGAPSACDVNGSPSACDVNGAPSEWARRGSWSRGWSSSPSTGVVGWRECSWIPYDPNKFGVPR